MNAQTAQNLGLSDNDMLEVTSPAGTIHIALLAPGHPPGLRLPYARVQHMSKGLNPVAYGEAPSDYRPAPRLL